MVDMHSPMQLPSEDDGSGLDFHNLEELEDLARPKLQAGAFGYYSGGAESEAALQDNRAALHRYRLLPRVLVDVSGVTTRCQLFGHELALPVLIAPMAMQRLCHPEGELAVARAAEATGTLDVVSTMATASMDEVAAAVDGPSCLWFQLYALTRRDVTELMVRDAERLGYKALVLTVDAPRLGKRDADARNRFSVPPGLALKNLQRIGEAAGLASGEGTAGSKFGAHFTRLVDDSLSWEAVSWLRSITSLPVLLKGVLSPDDARRAVAAGVDGIIVSNHGGRQLDYAPAPVDMLPAIAGAVQGRIKVLVDGGIRRGTDIVKCLALGADAVLLGRPVLYALALGGQAGVERALRLLREELELAMVLLGVRSVEEITPDFVLAPGSPTFVVPASRR